MNKLFKIILGAVGLVRRRGGVGAFDNSKEYWLARYENGGNSGVGSYNQFAKFKARILNEFVRAREVNSVIEFGCGDGNQLLLSEYPQYIGFDISPKAISLCCNLFVDDKSKKFLNLEGYSGESADLTLSLDVIYHLIEDEVFEGYMSRLFDSSNKYVIIYASNTDGSLGNTSPHVKHRNFCEWVAKNRSGWFFMEYIPNKYPYDIHSKAGSFSDFYIFGKHK